MSVFKRPLSLPCEGFGGLAAGWWGKLPSVRVSCKSLGIVSVYSSSHVGRVPSDTVGPVLFFVGSYFKFNIFCRSKDHHFFLSQFP